MFLCNSSSYTWYYSLWLQFSLSQIVCLTRALSLPHFLTLSHSHLILHSSPNLVTVFPIQAETSNAHFIQLSLSLSQTLSIQLPSHFTIFLCLNFSPLFPHFLSLPLLLFSFSSLSFPLSILCFSLYWSSITLAYLDAHSILTSTLWHLFLILHSSSCVDRRSEIDD